MAYSYSSADIVHSIIKIIFLQNFDVSFALFIYSLFISIGVYIANTIVRLNAELSVTSVSRELFWSVLR